MTLVRPRNLHTWGWNILRLALPLAILVHPLLCCSFITPVSFGIVFLFFAILFSRVSFRHSLLIATSILLGTYLSYGFFSRLDRDRTDGGFFRDYEPMLSSEDNGLVSRFKPNTTADIPILHGDSLMNAWFREIIPQRHAVHWKTDSLGFRNNAEYRGEKYILVGDSFVAGSGCTQSDTLREQLRRRGLSSYSVAFPFGIGGYARLYEFFAERHPGDHKILLFIYEGNDFPVFKINLFSSIRRRLGNWNIFSFTAHLHYQVRTNASTYRGLLTVGSRILATPIHEVTLRKEYRFPKMVIQALDRLKASTTHVFFIPEKYRVYYPLSDQASLPLPNAQWEALRAFCLQENLPCTNLTDPMIAESRELLKKNLFTYWSDDSHWTKHGIAVAARIIDEKIRSGEIR